MKIRHVIFVIFLFLYCMGLLVPTKITQNLPCQNIKFYDQKASHIIVGCSNTTNNTIQFLHIDLPTLLVSNYSDVINDNLNIRDVKTHVANTANSGEILCSRTSMAQIYRMQFPPNFSTASSTMMETASFIYQYDDIYRDFYVLENVAGSGKISIFSPTLLLKKSYSIHCTHLFSKRQYIVIFGHHSTNSQQKKIGIFNKISTVVQKYVSNIETSSLSKPQLCGDYFIFVQDTSIIRTVHLNGSLPQANLTEISHIAINGLKCINGTHIIIKNQNNQSLLYDFFTQQLIQQIELQDPSSIILGFDHSETQIKYIELNSLTLNSWKLSEEEEQTEPPPEANDTTTEANTTTTEVNIPTTEVTRLQEGAATLLAVTSVKVFFNSMVPLYLFIDELWLYKFHHNIEYPHLMNLGMNEATTVSVLKNKPKYLFFLQGKLQLDNLESNNQLYTQTLNMQKNEKGKGLNKQDNYFLYASWDIFTFGVISNTSIYLILFLTRVLLSLILRNIKIKVLKQLYHFFLYRTQIWVLFTMLLDSSFLGLCFNCFNQIATLVSFNFQTKISCTLAVNLMLIILLYSLVSYLLLKRFHKLASLRLLCFSKKTFQGYFNQNITFIFARVLNALSHSNIFVMHKVKVYAIILTSCILLLFQFIVRNHFYTKLTFITYSLHNIVFIFLNFGILFRQTQPQWVTTSPQTLQKILNAFIIILILLTIFSILLGISKIIGEVCCDGKSKKKNKIKPQSQINNPYEQQQQVRNWQISQKRSPQPKLNKKIQIIRIKKIKKVGSNTQNQSSKTKGQMFEKRQIESSILKNNSPNLKKKTKKKVQAFSFQEKNAQKNHYDSEDNKDVTQLKQKEKKGKKKKNTNKKTICFRLQQIYDNKLIMEIRR